ncbi:GIY-YIG nuclease family protein [uncultured Sneathiella sp.]|jgi:hypothetical protein|uniref:GIY-YIG nuclease family protein n=1 Tax=uncultured Sneathiella sp. TaxID=879315 RepID=UPI0030D93CB2|tara:strand:+ start:42775 stop:43563 length:789 start_codon:yes stop_codon:yes gene_type:complete
MERLTEVGFQKVGFWKLKDGHVDFELNSQENTINVLYAFVCEGEVMYIGKTIQPLRKRMYGYLRPGKSQSTNIKNRDNILASLVAGKGVEIFALPDNGLQNYGGFHINMAAGLEDSLISSLSPSWNGAQSKVIDLAGHSKVETSSSIGNEEFPVTQKKPLETISTDENLKFQFHLRKTYYNQGFFNVPVAYMDAFGNNNERIEISCGKHATLFEGHINRTANTNNTPRIMGGRQLTHWFKNSKNLDDQIKVTVVSPNSIFIE